LRSWGFTLVEAALALLLMGALASVIVGLADSLRSASAQRPLLEAFLTAEGLLEREDSSLPPCPSTAPLSLGSQSYQACQRVRLESQGDLEREFTTVELYQGTTLLLRLTRGSVSSSSASGSCQADRSRRAMLLELSPTGGSYSSFSLSWSPANPAGQRLRRIRVSSPLPQPLFNGNYASGSGYRPLMSPLVLALPVHLRLEFRRNFQPNTDYRFDLRLRDALGAEHGLVCTVRW
jgi:hypothetical protein